MTTTSEEAAQYFAQGQYREAIALYQQRIESDPSQSVNYWYLGLALFLQGESLDAQGVWLSAISPEDPETADRQMAELVEVLETQATHLLNAGQAELTRQVCEQILEVDTENCQAYNCLGIALAYLGKTDAALACWQQAIALEPNCLESYERKGRLHQQLGEFDRAIACYCELLDRQDNRAIIHYNLGICYFKQARLEAAMACFNAAISRQPNFAPAYGNLGFVRLLKGEIEEAISTLKTAIELQPEFARAYSRTYDNLKARLLQSLQQFKNSVDTYLHLGRVLASSAYLNRAIACLQKALDPDRDRGDICWSLARVLAKSEQFEQSISVYKIALNRYPKSPQLYLDLARVLIKLRDWTATIRTCETALSLDPTLDLACVILARALVATDCHNDAIATYQRALNLNPNSVEIYLELGQLLLQRNRISDSIHYLEIAMQRNSNIAKTVREILQQQHLETHPEVQAILPVNPPQTYYETTADWIDQTQIHDSACIPIHPETEIRLAPPKSCDRAIHYSFRFGDRVRLPPTFVAVIPQGRHWLNSNQTQSAVITPDNRILGDLSHQFPAFSPGHPSQHPSHHGILQLDKLPPIRHIDGTVAILAGLLDTVYFHWMFDILPRVELLRRSGVDFDTIDYFLIDRQLPFQRETLDALGIPPEKTLSTDRHSHLQASRLIVPSFPGTVAWMPPWTCDFLQNQFLTPAALETTPTVERLYISRTRATSRRILNETELIQGLQQYGVQSVELESMSVVQQAALFAKAKVIIAPHGSGLSNLAFCQPGTRVIELFSPNFVYSCYWLVSQLVGLDYYYYTGKTLPGSAFHRLIYPDPRLEDLLVDIGELSQLLDFAGIDLKSN